MNETRGSWNETPGIMNETRGGLNQTSGYVYGTPSILLASDISDIIATFFQIWNLLFLSIAIFLTTYIHLKTPNRRRTPQSIFLINLVVAEFVKDVILIINLTFRLSSTYNVYYAIVLYVYFGTVINYFIAMFILTADRLLNILLNIKYATYCTISRAKRLLIATWILCIVIVISLSCSFLNNLWNVRIIMFVSIPAVLYVIFLFFALSTYIIMFSTYVKSQRNTQRNTHSLWYIFSHSNFYICILLLSSFLFLVVIPYLITGLLILIGRSSISVNIYFVVSTSLSDFVDCIIYIFIQPKVRKLLFRISNSCFRVNKEVQITEMHGLTPTSVTRQTSV